jgi:hypothetical protein
MKDFSLSEHTNSNVCNAAGATTPKCLLIAGVTLFFVGFTACKDVPDDFLPVEIT